MRQALLSFIIATLSALPALSQQMIVHLKNGQQITYPINNVDSVEIQAPSSSSQQPYGSQLKGTAANAIDLGLSVRWADHNLGAANDSDCGDVFSFDDAPYKAAVWSDDWRLPTEAEWQELYQQCSWSWIVRNGIGGRLIKAHNGNTIFIPAAGVSFDDQIYIRGCIGIYWTANQESSTNAVGTYFDSANIYRMSYPKTNKFTVRLVRK